MHPPPESARARTGWCAQDYRVLHALLCQLSSSRASEELLGFLRVDEMLTDIADDLYDYEKDVCKNSFNVLRGCVGAERPHPPGGLLGADAPLELASKISELEREHERLLQTLPTSQREAYVMNRRRAMSNGADRWTFPKVLLPHQERELRASVAQAGEAVDSEEDEADRRSGPTGRAEASASRAAPPRACRGTDEEARKRSAGTRAAAHAPDDDDDGDRDATCEKPKAQKHQRAAEPRRYIQSGTN
jgi:hypothetical protein